MAALHLCKHALFHAGLENCDGVVFFDEPAVSLMLSHEGLKVCLSMIFLIFVVLVRKGFKIVLSGLESAELLKAYKCFRH
jgi:hypothetical protein